MNTYPKPLISIVTVCFNAETTIVPTLKSVKEQSETDYEHIIIDGASNDSTLRLIEEYKSDRTVVFSEPDKGIYHAMNKGLYKSNGKYVLFLNAGDTFASSETLSRFAEAIRQNPTADIFYGQTAIINSTGKILGPRHLTAPPRLNADSFKKGMLVCHQAFMVRHSIAPEYDTKYRFSADFDWCIRCLKNSKENIYLGSDAVAHYLNEGTTTLNHHKSLKERYKIMCRHYGAIPTILRHIQFAFRNVLYKIKLRFKA